MSTLNSDLTYHFYFAVLSRADKEALETNLFVAQQLVVQLESHKEQLEGENQTILLAKESLIGDLSAFI